MRAILILTTALCLVLSSTAYAQMGGGGMGGGGMGGGGGGGKRSGGKGGPPAGGSEATPDARPAAAIVPVSMRLKGIVTLAGVAKALKGGKITSDQPDVSGLYATRGAALTVDGVDIETTGAAVLVSDSHDYGINSALLIDNGSGVQMTGGHITTEGQGANGAYVSGEDSALTLHGVSLATAGTGAIGIDIRSGASFDATDTTVTTQSDHAPALSLQLQGPPTHITGGNFTTQGPSSPAFALSGNLEANNLTAASARTDGIAINGAYRVAFTNSVVAGGNYGAMIFVAPAADNAMAGAPMGGPDGGPPHGGRGGDQGGERGGGEKSGGRPNASGGADKPKGAGMRPVTDMMGPPPEHGPDGPGLSYTGGKLSGHRAVFFVTNIRTHIRLDSVDIASANGIIVKSVADQWGELGRNGGDTVLEGHHQILIGDFVTDVISHIAVNLSEGSHLTGKATRNTDVALDATSSWTLTADSSVGKLEADPAQIDSQGHTLSYDKFRNPAFNSQTIPLPGGGQLVPSGL